MSYRPRIPLTASLAFLLVSVWTLAYPAVAYTTALQPGNRALFRVTGSYSENVNTTEMVVLTIDGLNVTASFTDRYYDLTEGVSGFWLDIASGQRNSSNLIFAIGAGLNPGDTISDGPNPPIAIQSEQTRGCGGAQRLSNYASFQVTIPIGTRTAQGYWDKTSGVVCNFSFQDPGGDLNLNMTSTNLWAASMPPNPGAGQLDLVLWVLVAIVAIPIALLLGFRAGKRPKNRARG